MNLSTPLIGLGGHLRAGKDAVADRLVEKHGFVKVGFSDALLDHAIRLDPYIRVTLDESLDLRAQSPEFPLGVGYYRFNDLLEEFGYVTAKTIKDFREFMQRDGTEGGRNFFGENVWVNIVARTIDNHRGAGSPVVVTGVRYPNELQMIRELQGWPTWVERPGLDNSSAHTSENSVSMDDFDIVIENDSTLEALYGKVDKLADQLEIIGDAT